MDNREAVVTSAGTHYTHAPSPVRPVGGVARAGGGCAHVHLPGRRRRGARAIKVERPEGDFARYYDKLAVPKRPSPQPSPRKRGEGAHRASGETQEGDERTPGESGEGQSAYFVWLNRGKESLVLDLTHEDDKALLAAIIAKADVLVQNLKPGAVAKLGFPLEQLRRAHPRLVICSISGYGEAGPYAARK